MAAVLCVHVVPIDRELEPEDYGFDYAQAVREINHEEGWSYERIARYLGYKSKGSVADIAAGEAIPDHPRGERLYILYVEALGRKPPPNVRQTERAAND